MRKRYKVTLNVDIEGPDEPYTGEGDYPHKTRLDGVLMQIRLSAWRSERFATVKLDHIDDEGEIPESEQ